ncbi:MAG: tRNA adenosine(34) deaminase TadA [Acidobacteria bacterium]|nr:tRNA adenosine(34) deaminase TadA [Acidobacteriota bacterium]
MDSDQQFMRLALEEAEAAAHAGEVPVGAVIVLAGEVLARAHNSSIARNDPTAHAEILALRLAGERLANYRLSGADVYVTLEPCAMCAGALVQARVRRLVYGADDPKAGAVRSCARLLEAPFLNHCIEVRPGVFAEPCGALLERFFAQRRAEEKSSRATRR